MGIHNISEDLVFKAMQEVCDSLVAGGNPEGLCLCKQCRLDATCYVLNRMPPNYVASNRGMTRVEQDLVLKQQAGVDVTVLIYKGLHLVNSNKRPNTNHDDIKQDNGGKEHFFSFSTIVGRVFDGITFAPVKTATIELRHDGKTVSMLNSNWQNPFNLVVNTPGAFTFWPVPFPADEANIHKIFEFSIKVDSDKYEPLVHFFKIPSVSSRAQFPQQGEERTYRLPDLYLFQPGEAEING